MGAGRRRGRGGRRAWPCCPPPLGAGGGGGTRAAQQPQLRGQLTRPQLPAAEGLGATTGAGRSPSTLGNFPLSSSNFLGKLRSVCTLFSSLLSLRTAACRQNVCRHAKAKGGEKGGAYPYLMLMPAQSVADPLFSNFLSPQFFGAQRLGQASCN